MRSPELLDDCVHCGFCLPTCPTYTLWGEEMDSPRGRIQLMGLAHAAEDGPSPAVVTHLDRCLGCMACVTACPSGVKYDLLLQEARADVEREHGRSPADRAFRALVFALFPHPARLRALVPLLALQRRLPVKPPAAFPRLRNLAELAPPVKLRHAVTRLPEITPPAGTRRGRVGLLQGCVQRIFFPEVNAATVQVLAAEGFEVYAPRLPRCCGSLEQHTGYEESAQRLARATTEAFAGCDVVITNAAGCGSGMKEYDHLLPGDALAAEHAAKVRDVHEFLADLEPRAPRGAVPLRVAYHDACHLAHAQGVRAQPRALLRGIPGLEVLEPAGWEICCGSAGVYNLLEPEPASELGARKAQALLDTGAEAIAAANPGCALQIGRALEARGDPRRILHPIELLARSLAAAGP